MSTPRRTSSVHYVRTCLPAYSCTSTSMNADLLAAGSAEALGTHPGHEQALYI